MGPHPDTAGVVDRRRSFTVDQGGSIVSRFRRGIVWAVVGLLVFTLVATLVVDGTA
jgi:hypothetical protein